MIPLSLAMVFVLQFFCRFAVKIAARSLQWLFCCFSAVKQPLVICRGCFHYKTAAKQPLQISIGCFHCRTVAKQLLEICRCWLVAVLQSKRLLEIFWSTLYWKYFGRLSRKEGNKSNSFLEGLMMSLINLTSFTGLKWKKIMLGLKVWVSKWMLWLLSR